VIRPESRVIAAGVAALAIGFGLGLRAVPTHILAAQSAAQAVQPKNFDPAFEPWASPRSQTPISRGFQLASLETETVFVPGDGRPEPTESAAGRSSAVQERLPSTARAASFDERFAGAIDWPSNRQATEMERARSLLPAWPDLGHAAWRVAGPSARGLVPLPVPSPASVARKPVRVADASAVEDLSAPADTDDDHTAIYDISAHRVYLPNGQTLEAHSGFGSRLDDPRAVRERDLGPTPPNVYDLAMRDEPFHGVRALRLIPVGSGNMFGRDGLLAHTYMLGPNGQSNGCVSFSDYSTFLNAYLGGDINRLVVVEHLANAPSPKTSWGGVVATIKGLFGRS
jgi:hypothetical protein